MSDLNIKLMVNLNKKLMDEYGDTITDLSKTNQNIFIENSFKMINLDKMSKNLPNIENRFKGFEFSTADALYISNVNNELKLWFFEFKKLDFNKSDDKIHVTRLKECFEKMNACEHDCFINDESCSFYKLDEKLPEQLRDKSKVSLIKKPYESLSLFYYFWNDYKKDDYDLERNDLFNVTKFYILVSETETEYNSDFQIKKKNKSNNKHYLNNVKSIFKHLIGLNDYHYTKASAVNVETFKALLDKILLNKTNT